jgi:hypothetical protein
LKIDEGDKVKKALSYRYRE